MNKKFYIALAVDFVLLIVIGFLVSNVYNDKKKEFQKNNEYGEQSSVQNKPMNLFDRNYLAKNIWDNYLTQKTDIVMLGDSLTANVNWSELLGMANIVNRGIPSDTTDGVLNRMEYVYALNPKVCFIMIGVNDFFTGKKPAEVFNNYVRIIEELKKHGITPAIQSVLLLNPLNESYVQKNDDIRKLNELLKEYAGQNEIVFIDLADSILEKKDNMYYVDGIHITGNAYALWGYEIMPIIKEILEK